MRVVNSHVGAVTTVGWIRVPAQGRRITFVAQQVHHEAHVLHRADVLQHGWGVGSVKKQLAEKLQTLPPRDVVSRFQHLVKGREKDVVLFRKKRRAQVFVPGEDFLPIVTIIVSRGMGNQGGGVWWVGKALTRKLAAASLA